MTFKYRYRKQIIIGVLIFLLIGGISAFIIINYKGKETKDEIVVENNKLEKNNKIEDKYQVDIKGEIAYPGIYKINKDSRVIDVIKMAGDLTENADTSVINLSKRITDEMVIIIYSKEEVSNFKQTKEIEKQVEEKCIQKDEESLKNDACITSTNNSTNNKTSINNATLDELKKLPGIGDKKAKDIITYREKNGPFKKLEDIMKVNGIGESAYAQIKENITL